MDKVILTRQTLNPDRLATGLQRDDAGAVVNFSGTVRADSQGDRRLIALEYEAYEEMAMEQMKLIRQRAIENLKALDVVIAHRLGRLTLGEVSIFVAVFAAHRAEGFEACRWIVDQIKTDAPIWKKDVWSDGTTAWVDPAK